MSYGKMAQVYDKLMRDAPYDKWEQFAKQVFELNGKDVHTIIDLGCGTGNITRRLARNGYQLIGVDNSEEMLAYAEHGTHPDQKVKWFHQDLRLLEGFSNLDAAVSFRDVVNYITEEADIALVFQNVNRILRDNGLFVFDVHAMDHVEENLSGQTFAEIYDDLSYIWFCEGGKQGEVFHDLTFFVQNGDVYERFDENHHQRTYSISFYENLLKKSGFTVSNIYSDFIFGKPDRTGQRLFFVCTKIRGC